MSNQYRPSVPQSVRSTTTRRPSLVASVPNTSRTSNSASATTAHRSNNNMNNSSNNNSKNASPSSSSHNLHSSTKSNDSNTAQKKRFAKLEQYAFPDELSESVDTSLLLLKEFGVASSEGEKLLLQQTDDELNKMIANAQELQQRQQRQQSLSASSQLIPPMSRYTPFLTARKGLGAVTNNFNHTSRRSDAAPHHNRTASTASSTATTSRFNPGLIEELPEELPEEPQDNVVNPEKLTLDVKQVESDLDNDDDVLQFLSNTSNNENNNNVLTASANTSIPPPVLPQSSNMSVVTALPTTSILTRARSSSRFGKVMSEIVEPMEEAPKDFSSTCSPGELLSGVAIQQRKRPTSFAANKNHKNDERENDDDENLVENLAQQPLWPELPSYLRTSICITDAEYKKQLQDLYSRVEPSKHAAHQFGATPQEELDENDDDDEFNSSTSSTAAKKNTKKNVTGRDDEEEEVEEMMETLEAGPIKSITHAASSPAPRKMYYFEQKSILDAQAATLEQAAPAIVSAAVRASQSPFAPWCSFHQQQLEKVGGYAIATEVQRLLDEGASTSAADIGSSIMATPLGFNIAWRTTGVSIDPVHEHLILTPAVSVPGAIINRRDAALDIGMFKSVVIRGIPKFERGVQTTLTAFHENSMWFTVSRNALQQQEQIGRTSIASERSFCMMHFTSLDNHGKENAKWNTDLISKKPTNIMALHLAQIREKKGELKMLKNLLTVPTSDGRQLAEVWEQDQKEIFDDAIVLAQHLIVTTTATSIPILELIKMEAEVREQEIRSYNAWVGSMEYRSALIRMSYSKRCSSKVKHSLRTRTKLDEEIASVNAALSSTRKVDADEKK